MKDQILNKPSTALAIPLIVSWFFGLLVVSDPFLTNIAANFYITFLGKNIFKLYPYEITSIFFIFVLCYYLGKRILRMVFVKFEKMALVAIIGFSQTIALHKLDLLDGADMMIGIVFIITMFKALIKKEEINLSLLVILDIFLFSFLVIASINGGIYSLITGLICIKLTMLTVIITNLIYNESLLKFYIKCLIIATTASSVIAIIQEIIFVTTGIIAIGISETESIKYMFEETAFGTFLRVPAFIVSYKMFAFYLVTNILIIFNYFLYVRPENIKKKIYLIIALFLMTVALMLTFSWDSMLALAVCVLLSILVRSPRFIVYYFLVAVALFLVVYFAGFIDDIKSTFFTEFSWGEYRIRVQLDREGIYGFLNRYPFIGVGNRNGAEYTSSYWTWPAHNAIILALDEVGIFGFIAYLLPIIYTLLTLVMLNISITDCKNKALARGLLFSIICLLIILMTHAGWFENVLWMYMSLTQAFAIVIRERQQKIALRI